MTSTLFSSPVAPDVLDAFERYARANLRLLLSLPVCEGRSGGYLVVRSAAHGSDAPPLRVSLLGSPPMEKAGKYFGFGGEKAGRLADRPDDLSSWVTRNVEAEQYGGGVRGRSLVSSFSGLDEPEDETLVALSLLEVGQITRPTVLQVAEISGNDLLRRLLDNR